jgi:hypothetical protein
VQDIFISHNYPLGAKNAHKKYHKAENEYYYAAGNKAKASKAHKFNSLKAVFKRLVE